MHLGVSTSFIKKMKKYPHFTKPKEEFHNNINDFIFRYLNMYSPSDFEAEFETETEVVTTSD